MIIEAKHRQQGSYFGRFLYAGIYCSELEIKEKVDAQGIPKQLCPIYGTVVEEIYILEIGLLAGNQSLTKKRSTRIATMIMIQKKKQFQG